MPASCDHTPVVSSAEFFFNKLKVNSTSLLVNGWPSLHFTPSRSVNTSVLESVNCWPVARNWLNWPFTELAIASGS